MTKAKSIRSSSSPHSTIELCRLGALLSLPRKGVQTAGHFGATEANMTSTGTVSDFDRVGRFGLIVADDGRLLPFNLTGTPPSLRSRFEMGTRVKFTKYAAQPTTRAVNVTPIDERNEPILRGEQSAEVLSEKR
jgi:hypothetical protein